MAGFLPTLLGIYDRNLARSYFSLRSFLEAGFSIGEAFEKTDFSGIISSDRKTHISSSLRAGKNLTQSLDETRPFPKVDLACLAGAEKSGHIPEVLQELARGHELGSGLRQKAITQLLYPFFYIHAGAFLLSTNKFLKEGTFSFLLEVGRILLMFYMAGFILVFLYTWLPKSPLAPMYYSLPIVGRFRRHLELMNFTRAFRYLHEAGVEIVQTYRFASETLSSGWLRNCLLRGLPHLESRENLFTAVKASGVFYESELQIISTGETTGSLGEAFKRLEKFLRDRGEEGMKRFGIFLNTGITLSILLWMAYRIIGFYSGHFSQYRELLGK